MSADVDLIRQALENLRGFIGQRAYIDTQAFGIPSEREHLLAALDLLADRVAALETALRDVQSVLEDDEDWNLASNFERIAAITAIALAPSGSPGEGQREALAEAIRFLEDVAPPKDTTRNRISAALMCLRETLK